MTGSFGNPDWTAVHGPQERESCLDYVRVNWTDWTDLGSGGLRAAC
ncbi:MAG: hypothetical protein ABIS86_23230 [Streptosporangiaceae bacterium]